MTATLGSSLEIELLKRTPSSYLGSCRYKLPDYLTHPEVYEKLFAILKKMDIGYFFYIGGNDSMDTICKLSDYARQVGSDIRFMGVPKTIDNDLMMTDHTPGYGSAAKYIGVVMKEIIRDATVYGTNYVTIVEIMGRNAGWLTAAAALARSEDCEGVNMICLPEVPFNAGGHYFIDKVARMQKESASVVIAVSEGVKLEDGAVMSVNRPMDAHCCRCSSVHKKSLDGYGAANSVESVLRVAPKTKTTLHRAVHADSAARAQYVKPHGHHRSLIRSAARRQKRRLKETLGKRWLLLERIVRRSVSMCDEAG